MDGLDCIVGSAFCFCILFVDVGGCFIHLAIFYASFATRHLWSFVVTGCHLLCVIYGHLLLLVVIGCVGLFSVYFYDYGYLIIYWLIG